MNKNANQKNLVKHEYQILRENYQVGAKVSAL